MGKKYLLTIDLGFTNNLAVLLVDLRTKEPLYKKVYPLLGPNRNLTNEKDKKDFWQDINLTIAMIFGDFLESYSPTSSKLKLEAQISNRKWGRQLTLLEGILMGQAFSLGFKIQKSRRNLDLCKKYKITAARKDITTENKKRMTIKRVNELWPAISLDYSEDSKHLCDAALLALEEIL
jgi:hypothetical protein